LKIDAQAIRHDKEYQESDSSLREIMDLILDEHVSVFQGLSWLEKAVARRQDATDHLIRQSCNKMIAAVSSVANSPDVPTRSLIHVSAVKLTDSHAS
jgi:Mg2+ and Co2+ transporter CorA